MSGKQRAGEPAYEVEVDITRTATKVDIAPWKTAEPVPCSAWSVRSCLVPFATTKECATCAE